MINRYIVFYCISNLHAQNFEFLEIIPIFVQKLIKITRYD